MITSKRHSKKRDLFGEPCKNTWDNVTTEATITEDDSGLRGDLAYCGVWGVQREALFDICVIDTDALSYVYAPLIPVASILSSAEGEKKNI